MTDQCAECARGFAEHFDVILRLGPEDVSRSICRACYEQFHADGQIIEDPSGAIHRLNVKAGVSTEGLKR